MNRLMWHQASALSSKLRGWVTMLSPLVLLALGPCGGGTGGGYGY